MTMTIRTRIAPSPTGIPHTGTIRTALYDYLLAKKYSGQFILRVEDTDQKRYVEGSIDKIYEIFDLLEMKRDEDPVIGGPYGPYIQTERLDIYKEYAQKLIDADAAYYCFCTEERLSQLHEVNKFAKYDRHCRHLSKEEVNARLAAGEPYVIRTKLPETGFTSWQDMIQGKLSLPNSECDDKVLMKSNGIPTYHLAVVVDDYLMKITHALRGVEWMASTPVHLFLYQALGWEPPIYGHLPLLLGPDKTKLAKRHGAKSVLEYRDEGYLPEAILNFLLYLGFSYQDNSAILSLEEMVKIFDEKKIQKQNAIFDIQRLNYLNTQWIRKISEEDLLERLLPFIPQNFSVTKEKLTHIIPLVKDRLVTLKDISSLIDFFFVMPPITAQNLLSQSEKDSQTTISWLLKVKEIISAQTELKSETLHEILKVEQSKTDMTPRQAFMSLRLALTGKPVTPPIFDCVVVMGKEESINRIDKAINLLS